MFGVFMPFFRTIRFSLTVVAGLAGVTASIAGAQTAPKTNVYGNPQRVAPAPTHAAIDVHDLQVRLYQFADDSMQGRQVGRVGNQKGTDYLASEVKRLGLVPAGDNGTYFQVLPYHVRKFTNHSRLTLDGNPLAFNADFVPVPGQRAPRAVTNADVVYGGVTGDAGTYVPVAQTVGKFVVMAPAVRAAGAGGAGGGGRGGPGGPGGVGQPAPYPDAVAIATVDLDALTPMQRAAINEPTSASQAGGGRGGRGGAPVDSSKLKMDSVSVFGRQVDALKTQVAQLAPQAVFRISRDAATQLFKGKPIDALSPGAVGGTLTASLDFVEMPTDWARNVVAILPGSDPKLKYQYVAIGAHNDHVGFATPADKDSIRAYNIARNRYLLANGMNQLKAAGAMTADGWKVNMDSIRKIYPKARVDSINNGADDDGSGSMGVLEIAEAMAAMPVKPKRSTLFVWHAGEEAGLVGSAFFVANPTVPLDSVVTQINIDMIGRGRADDLPGGGPDYVGVVGSFFDSKDLGETVQAVNRKQSKPLDLDYKFDKPIDWGGYNNIYQRSDHYNYARSGVPIAFFFTGLHGDYHQRSDEPEFIDYPHYAKIANYIKELVVEVGNGPRPRLNGTQPAKPRTIMP